MVQTLPPAYEGEDIPIRITFTQDSDGSEVAPDGATASGPTITVTDPQGTDVVSAVVMTQVDTGTYEHVWDTASDSGSTGTYDVEVTGEFSSETKIEKAEITLS